MISGTIVVDLANVPADNMRHRAAGLEHGPQGAPVVLMVGATKPDPATVDLLRSLAGRRGHNIDVWGTGYAVKRWVRALRDGMDVL